VQIASIGINGAASSGKPEETAMLPLLAIVLIAAAVLSPPLGRRRHVRYVRSSALVLVRRR
jgi:hypothetical protein